MAGSGHQRDNNGRFVKGTSGNKSGRPKVVTKIRELALKHAPGAFNRIIDLTASENEKVALAACQEVLNRAYGKPEQSHKLEGGLKPTVVVVRKDGGGADVGA